MEGSVAFGVVGGTVDEPRVGYLTKPRLVTDELLALSGPVQPTEVFRFAAPCAERGCRHFDGSRCRLVMKTVRVLPEASLDLPPCVIRPNCRWWQQEGKAACLRCPIIVTENYQPTEQLIRVADPTV
jgi:hypothetical protein